MQGRRLGRSSPRVGIGPIAIAALVGALAGYVAHGSQKSQVNSPVAPVAVESGSSTADRCPNVIPAQLAQKPSGPPSAAIPTVSAETPDAHEGVERYRRQQSKELMNALHAQISLFKLEALPTSPEGLANGVDVYLLGWTDALTRAAPEITGELSEEIEQAMCSGEAEDGQLVVLSRAVTRMPELATARGLECLIGRQQEDIVTWSALDAWQASADRLQASSVLAQLEGQSHDERTLGRLRDIRTPGAQSIRPPRLGN